MGVIGIHNAWDTVTYITVDLAHGSGEPEDRVEDDPTEAPHFSVNEASGKTPKGKRKSGTTHKKQPPKT